MNLDDSLRRGAEDHARHSRWNGVVALFDDLAGQGELTPDDYRRYFMAWELTRVLHPRPGDLASPASASTLPAA